ncbi:sigma-70 family RNA polymerase sigma factor [Marmoricola sp. URHB0036]|uniref:sigma-70 family RNA polymerase sigma factor n=1 Tax=Marmoricola sp. URHB0036 TaxID=1298863 RepID=UPI000483B603|nr:sigma-70 family RNA polymerase sigma factor [Marmoricola sp. URHB0036]
MNPPSAVLSRTPHDTHRADERYGRTERTRELVARLAYCVDDDERHELTNELAAVNMPVADSVVSRYRSRGVATEDLQQVAYLALTKAARRFDPEAGHDFLSFCVPTIRGEVRRYFRDKGWMVRPPRRIQELQARLSQAQRDLAITLGRPATVDELSEHLDEQPADVREALDGHGCFTPTSLDKPVGEEQGASLGELIGDEDRDQSAAEARVVLAPVVRRLSERDRRILELRFFEGLTQREIAEDLGVTQMQVSRLLTRIFRDIRQDLGSVGDPGVRD